MGPKLFQDEVIGEGRNMRILTMTVILGVTARGARSASGATTDAGGERQPQRQLRRRREEETKSSGCCSGAFIFFPFAGAVVCGSFVCPCVCCGSACVLRRGVTPISLSLLVSSYFSLLPITSYPKKFWTLAMARIRTSTSPRLGCFLIFIFTLQLP